MSEQIRIDAILIDDDPLIATVWKVTASRKGKTVQVFSTFDAFKKICENISRDIPIYVDQELGNGTKGHLLIPIISRLGFTTIYLATGYNAQNFSEIEGLKAVTGKEPPWI